MADGFLIDSLIRYIGQTVTIFTESGGLSGSGFTGVLAAVCDGTIKLITDIGAPPACPVGSCCDYPGYVGGYGGGYSGYGYGYGGGSYGYGGYNGGNCGYGYGRGNACGSYGGCNWLGSVTEIPVDSTKYTPLDSLIHGLLGFSKICTEQGLWGSGDRGVNH